MKVISYLGLSICAIIMMAFPKTDALSNTSWKGFLNVPDPTDASLKFSGDTLYVYINAELIETSTYSVKSDTLNLIKVSGNSPCTNEVGIYTYEIDKNTLMIRPVSDVCEARFYAFDPMGYEKKE